MSAPFENLSTAYAGRRVCTAALIVASMLSLAACDLWISADQRVERAAEHLAKGQYRPAMTDLKTALQDEPAHVGARLALADLSLWMGDLEGAQKELSRALEAGAADAQVKPLQYELLLAQNRFDDAGKLLDEDQTTTSVRRLVLEARIAAGRGDQKLAEEKLALALQEAPEDPEALLESARLAAARGDAQPALDLPGRLQQSGDAYARALYLRGAALMNRGEHSEARDAFAEAQAAGKRLRAPEQLAIAAARTEANLALNDVAAADKSLAAVAAWGSKSLVEHYLRARVAMLKQDFIAAVAECQRALRIAPGHVQSQVLLAAAHLSQGSMEQAQDVLTRLLAANPENLAARKLLAQVYLGRNQPAEAQRVLGAAGSGAAGDDELDWLMGAALMRGGSIDAGLQRLQRSAAAAPQDMARRIDLAGAYIAAREPDKAVELLSSVPADSALASRARLLLVLATASGKPRAEARREVEALAAKHPDDADLISVAGAYLAAVGDAALGRKLLGRATELEPQAINARLSLARLEAGARNVDEAQRLLREVVELDPKHQGARVGLAELAWSSGDRDRARKWLEEAVSADPSAVDARLRLAHIGFIEGDAVRARGLLDQALKVAADRKTALTATGRVLARVGLNDEALARLREAAAAGDGAATLEAARLHLEMNDPGKAREVVQAALTLRPDWREAEQYLVVIDAREGHVARALERARKLAGDASPMQLRVLEGDLYSMAGQSDQAIAAYEAAQRAQPSAQVAVKIFNARRVAGAGSPERSLTQWLERAPEDDSVRRVLAAHYESQGQSDRAVAQYERLLAAGRIDPPMLNNLAWSLHQRGDPRALELARRAYAEAPQFAEIGDTYGWILVQMDKVAEGLPVLEKALAIAPANPDIQYHAAYAYARSGQTARAAELVRQSLESGQPFFSRTAAEQLLQSMTTPSG